MPRTTLSTTHQGKVTIVMTTDVIHRRTWLKLKVVFICAVDPLCLNPTMHRGALSAVPFANWTDLRENIHPRTTPCRPPSDLRACASNSVHNRTWFVENTRLPRPLPMSRERWNFDLPFCIPVPNPFANWPINCGPFGKNTSIREVAWHTNCPSWRHY